MNNHGGKGSGRRPSDVPDDIVQNNWDTIFGKKKEDTTKSENKEQDKQEN